MLRRFFFRKPIRPFDRLYKGLTPKDFITLFSNEYACVIVFILSFCSKRYVNNVLKLLDIRDKEIPYEERVSRFIRNTLSSDYTPLLSTSMFGCVENAVHRKLGENKFAWFTKGFSKSVKFKHPKEAVCKVSE